MSRHNKIIKRKSDKEKLLADPSAKSMEWLDHHGMKIGVLALVIFVIGLGALGMVYYRKVTANDARKRLYDAATLEQKAQAGAGSVAEAIDGYEKIITSGAPAVISIQARMALAELYLNSGDPAKAAEHFAQAATAAGENTMFGEFAQAGLAQAWASGGKTAEAEARLVALSKNAKYYPKAELLLALGYIQATAGKVEEAKKTLAQIKTGEEGLISSAPVEETIGMIGRGEIALGLLELKKAMDQAARNRELKAQERPSIQITTTPTAPVAPGAVHPAGEAAPK